MMRRLVGLLALGALLTGGALGVAWAEPTLLRTLPPAEQLDRTSALTLVFDEPLIARRTQVRLTSAGGEDIALRVRFSASGRSLTAAPRRSLDPGAYRLEWRALGQTGAPAEGGYDILVR